MAHALKVGVLLGAAAAAVLAFRGARDPRVVFLVSHPPARWLRAAGPARLRADLAAESFTRFRAAFEAPPAGADADVCLRARASSQVVLDGREVLPPGSPEGGWKSPRCVRLTAGPGRHELLVVVRSEAGPALLWAQSPGLGLRTSERWEASVDGGATWGAAQDAQKPLASPEFEGLPSAAEGFSRTALFLLPLLALGAWSSRRLGDRRLERAGLLLASAAWAVLAAAALAVLLPGVGYDAREHAQYVAGLARTWRLPAPGDGWQTFQPPLYYLIGVPLHRLALALGQEPASWLRAPSLISGFLLGLSCRWYVQTVRPGRGDLALAAGLFGWFWPASLLIAQTPSNEPLAGALSALFLVVAARQAEASRREPALLGLLLGAALLAKATAVLVVPAALVLLTRRGAGSRPSAREWSVLAGAAFVAGGWFYARHWAFYGTAFIGGWDPARGLAWSQDPGCRSAGDLVRFGAALVKPFYAGLDGFWDSLYASFWSDGWLSGATSMAGIAPRPADWQAAGAWWGLVPTGLMCLGAGRAVARADAAARAALVGVLGGAAALAWMFLAVPAYSTVKASYLLGLGPLFALLLADGLDVLRGRWRAAAWGGSLAWAAAAFRAALPL